jgi:hypothetical protein
MHDVARTAAKDGVKLVFANDRKAGLASVFEARKPVPKIPAPRTLADIARQGADIPDLRCRDACRCFGQHRVLAANRRLLAESVERD